MQERKTTPARKYHPGRDCTTCALCHKEDQYFTHFGAWPKHLQAFIERYIPAPSEDSCICRAHLYEAKRQHGNPEYTPKWLKLPSPPTGITAKKCAHQECTEHNRLIHAGFASRSVLAEYLDIPVPENSLYLCGKHYTAAHKKLKTKPCASCGAKPREGPFNRHSPNPDMANQSIARNGLSIKQIKGEDALCLQCYKLHLAIIEDMPCSDEQLVSIMGTCTTADNSRVDNALAVACYILARNFLKQ